VSAPRIAPGGRREVGLATWALAHAAGRVAGTRPPHLFLTLGRHRRLFRGWLRFAGRLMPRGTLPRRETELVILRVAHLRGCAYEHEHHVRLARRARVPDDDIARVADGPGAAGWTPRERAILAAVDELHARGDLSDAAWDALRAHLAEPELIELVLLAGHYEMLATAITTLRIQPDRPIHQRASWLPAER
jgi:AhpD family alkylhydroperoxidase